jgi:hypothetical protein
VPNDRNKAFVPIPTPFLTAANPYLKPHLDNIPYATLAKKPFSALSLEQSPIVASLFKILRLDGDFLNI